MARILLDRGGDVLDTDDVAHDLEGAGGEAVPAVVRAFGDQVLSRDGSVDRRRLGEIVFSDSEALARLDSIMHPLIVRKVEDWLDSPGDAPFKAVLVPLLFESGFDVAIRWDAVIAVVCREEEQMRRLRGRGLDDSAARARIAAQLPCSVKAGKADWTICNDSDLASLRNEVDKALIGLAI